MNYPPLNLTPLAPRRLVSASGTTEIPSSLHGFSPLPELESPRPPQEIEDRRGEVARIVKRLSSIIAAHRVAALRLSFSLDSSAVVQVTLALEAEIRREDPLPYLADPDVIRHYVLTSLYEELLAEPSNILHTTYLAPDVVRYEAMEVRFWQECVAGLK